MAMSKRNKSRRGIRYTMEMSPYSDKAPSDADVSPTDGDDEQDESKTTVGALAQLAGLSKDHSLINFYVSNRATAFIEHYQPCDENDLGAERISEIKLRSLLKAYVCSVGDPLKLYMLQLKMAGYSFSIDITGEEVMYVKPRSVHHGSNQWMREAEGMNNNS